MSWMAVAPMRCRGAAPPASGAAAMGNLSVRTHGVAVLWAAAFLSALASCCLDHCGAHHSLEPADETGHHREGIAATVFSLREAAELLRSLRPDDIQQPADRIGDMGGEKDQGENVALCDIAAGGVRGRPPGWREPAASMTAIVRT